jgi:hypothetical protein
MKRRPLDFRTFDEVIADLDRLQGGYRKGGNWSLGQVCNHLGLFVRGSLDGFSGPKPRWYIRLVAPAITRWMIKKRRMPEGVKIPRHLQPAEGLDDAREVQELKDLLQRFEKHHGPLHQSPFAGDASRETWREIHLIHCAHHLSFLYPADEARA